MREGRPRFGAAFRLTFPSPNRRLLSATFRVRTLSTTPEPGPSEARGRSHGAFGNEFGDRHSNRRLFQPKRRVPADRSI